MLAELSDSLRKLVGRQIVVPAKTVGLSDAEQSLQGKVVDTNQEENSLWCTVTGDKRWYGSSLLAACSRTTCLLGRVPSAIKDKNELCATCQLQACLRNAQTIAGTAGTLMRSLRGWWNKKTP